MPILTGDQMMEWEAYDQLEPIGGFRQDYRFAQLCHLIFEVAQSAFGKKGHRIKATVWDFMPWSDRTEKATRKKQTPEEIKAALLKAFQLMGKTPKRKK